MMRAAPEAKSRSFGIDLWNTRQTTCPSCATGQSPQHEFVRAAAPRRLLRRGPELFRFSAEPLLSCEPWRYDVAYERRTVGSTGEWRSPG